MRFLKNNILLLTFCFLVSVISFDPKNVLAGGDPSIKDLKVNDKSNNIKQNREYLRTIRMWDFIRKWSQTFTIHHNKWY